MGLKTRLSDQDWAKQRGVIVEIYPVGKAVKVSAADPRTLTEVSISGPAHYSEQLLVNNAIRKLRYVMEKEGKS